MEIDCNSDMDDNIDEIVSIVESSNGSDGREADAIISGKIEKKEWSGRAEVPSFSVFPLPGVISCY